MNESQLRKAALCTGVLGIILLITAHHIAPIPERDLFAANQYQQVTAQIAGIVHRGNSTMYTLSIQLPGYADTSFDVQPGDLVTITGRSIHTQHGYAFAIEDMTAVSSS